MRGVVGVGQGNGMGKYLTILSYSIEQTAFSIEHDIIIPTEFNKLYSSSLSYLLSFELL